MKELSIFIDESGDFGAYEPHSSFYIVTLVFHDQSKDISKNINILDSKIRNYGKSELIFFTSARDLEKAYMNAIIRKRFP